jgi:hypothetical protein
MKVGERRQQGREGAKPKTICPKCEREYLKTAWMLENRKYRRVGLCCPSPSCDYILKDFIELEDAEEEIENNTDKAEKIKKLTQEFVKKHEELSRLAEMINELEKE